MDKNPDANRGFFFAMSKTPLKIAVQPRLRTAEKIPLPSHFS